MAKVDDRHTYQNLHRKKAWDETTQSTGPRPKVQAKAFHDLNKTFPSSAQEWYRNTTFNNKHTQERTRITRSSKRHTQHQPAAKEETSSSPVLIYSSKNRPLNTSPNRIHTLAHLTSIPCSIPFASFSQMTSYSSAGMTRSTYTPRVPSVSLLFRHPVRDKQSEGKIGGKTTHRARKRLPQHTTKRLLPRRRALRVDVARVCAQRGVTFRIHPGALSVVEGEHLVDSHSPPPRTRYCRGDVRCKEVMYVR
jgi:hypothetical protein